MAQRGFLALLYLIAMPYLGIFLLEGEEHSVYHSERRSDIVVRKLCRILIIIMVIYINLKYYYGRWRYGNRLCVIE
jgi:hypothetical protein